ncbi:uncharacterized protein LOC134815420 [Bolinopsis microptera]|uniref:uncharacterized protein LOC134815420 n=1 Tax=Bolinopsis microptera TaxID=2820187 RepID=UPI0030793534
MVASFLLLLSCLTALTVAAKVPCSAIPEHGDVTKGGEGVYNFRCLDTDKHELVGRTSALCDSDGFFEIASLPKCVEKQPLTTHIKTTHSGLECTKEKVAERHSLLLRYLSQALCMKEQTCVLKGMSFTCSSPFKVTIESVFTVSDSRAGDDLVDLASRLSESKHSRQRRDINFDDFDTEDPVTSACEDGEGVSSNGDNCVECPEGMYGDGATTPKCVECALGTYNAASKQTECTACVSPKSTLLTGSTAADDCKILCTLPAASENSQYTISGVAKSDGTTVEVGSVFTLLCDQGHTFKNENKFTQTCTDGLQTAEIKNECFKVTTTPDVAVYKFLGETASITCVGESTVDPHLIEVRDPVPTGLTVSPVANTGTCDATNKNEKPEFSVTSAATSGRFELSCDMQVYSDISEKELSADSTTVVFMKAVEPAANIDTDVGAALTLAALVSLDDASTYSFAWTKDGSTYNTAQNSDTTVTGLAYKSSSVTIASVTLEDKGTYVATVTVSDLTGTQMLTKTFTTVVAIKGFSVQPQDAGGDTSVIQAEGSQAVLTCAFSGTIDASETFTWTKDAETTDANDEAFMAVTAETKDGSLYKYLTINAFPAGWTDTKFVCKVFKTSDKSELYKSEAISLSSSPYVVTMDAADKCTEDGKDIEFECTASFPDSITNGPTVTWHKVSEAGDTLVEDGDNYVVQGSKDGIIFKSIMTVDKASSTQAGSFYCVATYTEPDYLQISKKTDARSLTVVDLAPIPKKYVLIGDTDIILTTTFTGQKPLAAKWSNEAGDELVTGADYTVVGDVSADNGPYTLSLLIKTVSASTPVGFYVELNLAPECDGLAVMNQYTEDAELEILAATISTDATEFKAENDYAFEGSDVKFTCLYSNPSDQAAPAVTWTATATNGGAAISTGTPDNSAAASSPEGKVVITLSSVTVDGHSGTYKCDAAYPNSIGTAASSIRNLHVIGFKPLTTTYVGEGGDTKVTCTFTGKTGVVTWSQTGNTKDLSSNVNTGNYENGEITSELSLTNAQHATDEGQYSCTMKYSEITEEKELQPWLKIMRITEVTAVPVYNVLAAKFDLSCKISWDVADLSYTPTVTWQLTDTAGAPKALTNANTDKYTFTVASSAATDMGSYQCKVDFNGVEVTGDVTVYVRTPPVFAVSVANPTASNFNSPSTVVLGAPVTLSCTFSGDATGDVLWYEGTNILTDTSLYTLDAAAHTTYGATSSAVILSVIDATHEGTYKCKSTYTSDSVDTESNALTLSVLGATGVTSSKRFANKGDDITFTCNYLELTGDDSPATWSVQGDALTKAATNTATSSEFTVTGATVESNGKATCTVTYSNSLTNSVEVDQYVRDTVFGNVIDGKLYALKGAQAVLTCVIHGDGLKEDIEWTPAGTANTETYTSESTSSTYTITSVAEADEVEYTCSGRYSEDDVKSTAAQTLTVLKVTVTGTSPVNKAGDTTLTCDPVDVASTYSWTKGANPINGETGNTLILSGVDFTAAADYKCTVVYLHSLGTLESEAFPVFVQGFVSLEQGPKVGSYNEVGETITLKATITSPTSPDTFKLYKGDDTDVTPITNTPAPTQNAVDQSWDVEIEFLATKVAGKTVAYKLVVENTGSIESTVSIDVFEKCPVEAVADITALDGTPLDHMGTISNLECTGGKSLLGSPAAACNDGVLTWSAPLSAQPECIELAVQTDPVDQLVEIGKETTMSCSSITTPVTVASVEWFNGDGVVHTDTNPAAVQESGGTRNVYTSNYKITGANALNEVSYGCRMITDADKTVESHLAKVYIVGIKSITSTYPGQYFESDNSGVADYSETGTIKFEVYVGPGVSSQTSKLEIGGADVVVTFTSGTETDNLMPYSYTIAEENKKTGTYTVTVTYTKPTDANGDASYSTTIFLPVYQFCKVTELPDVERGSWTPGDKVDHRGYATLSCADDADGNKWYMKGDGVAQCLMGSENFQWETLTPAPTCNPQSELVEKCGLLEEPEFGDVVYKDENTAYFTCGAGYTLIGAEQEYTCDSDTGAWSIITKDNPNGHPPKCQATVAAVTRHVIVSGMEITVSENVCSDEAGKDRVSNALKAYLEDEDIVRCTVESYCTWEDFTCTAADSLLTVGFKLSQITSLNDKTVVTEDEARIKSQAPTKTFQVNTESNKRAIVSATINKVTTDVATTCSAGYARIDNSCSSCPSGWGYAGDTCVPCSIGSYSTGNSISACTQCTDAKTTYNIGSTLAAACVEGAAVCTIGVAAGVATFVPPTGSRVEFDKLISVTCGVGHALAVDADNTFKCGATAPACYEVCLLADRSTDELKALFIHDNIDATGQLVHNEKIQVTCMAGYELAEDEPVKSYTCNDGTLPVFQACIEQAGSQVLTTVIVCVVVLGVAVILLFLFIIVQWRKKKNAASYKLRGEKGFMDPIENMAAEEGTGVQMKKVSLKLSEADKKAPLMSRPVHISDFSKYYDLLTRNDDRELKQEFSTFDSFDDNNTCYHGSIPENDTKNRYKNIIPFDHSRVKLSIMNDDVHSDYINASYIHGYHKPRVFVATQAPLYETLDDFWRWCGRKKSTMVVNLTKVEENGKTKSIVYWPSVEERAKQFGLVNVKRVDKQESEYFVVYSFEIRHKLEEGVREVYMFNYVGWPDFDVPSRTTEFVNFIYNIRHLSSSDHPWVL